MFSFKFLLWESWLHFVLVTNWEAYSLSDSQISLSNIIRCVMEKRTCQTKINCWFVKATVFLSRLLHVSSYSFPASPSFQLILSMIVIWICSIILELSYPKIRMSILPNDRFPQVSSIFTFRNTVHYLFLKVVSLEC